MRTEEVADLPSWLVLRLEAKVQIRPVEAVRDGPRWFREELRDDVAPGGRVGGGGERDHLQPAERLAQAGERPVFGPEIMTPLRDAMRLVDGQPLDAGRLETFDEGRVGEPLGRNVEEAERPVFEEPPGLVGFLLVVRRIQR